MMLENYLDVYRNHEGKISHKWIHTFPIYDKLLKKFRAREEPVTILEIGVQNGGSLEIWEKYLPKNSQVHGIDINSKCCNLKFNRNIHFHLGNAADNKFMNNEFNGVEFDIILDDGSHISKDVINTFLNMFPKIKNGGVYIVEDLHASYWKKFGGGYLKRNSSIEFFKKLVDATNYDYIKKSWKNKCFHRKKYSLIKSHSEMIAEIAFFDSVCAIEKFYGVKTSRFEAVLTGTSSDVVVSTKGKHIKNEHELVNRIIELYDGMPPPPPPIHTPNT